MHATLKHTLARMQHSHACMHTAHDARHTLNYMKKMTSHSMNNHRFMKCPLLTALANQSFLYCVLPALGH